VRAARPVLLLTLLLGLLTGCGGDGGDGSAAEIGQSQTETTGSSLPEWVEGRLASREGPDVALVMGTSDHAVGANRLSFLVVRNDNSLVEAPEARLLVAREGATQGTATTAELVPIIPHSHGAGEEEAADDDVTSIYVANVQLDEPGRYWLVAEPDGEEIQGVGSVEVRETSLTPAVGAEAIPSDNPTLDDAPAEEITTADPPDTGLLRYSVADSLEEGVPFVVAFATPAFCTSRTCGPTVEAVDRVRQELEGEGVRFIHIEIYEGNDPENGVNEWVREWNLPTEPWVFLVDADGIIRTKFEGSASIGELRRAVERELLG
jgi:hypothetical protein